MTPLLEIKNLSVRFPLSGGDILAVRDVSLSIRKGRTLGIVGESGCGKSVMAYSILRLVPPPGVIDSGAILYQGHDIMRMNEDEVRKIRGKEIAMIFQEPMTSLNPVFTVGYQIMESITLHMGMPKNEARDYAAELLNSVGIPDPAKRLNSYPHELSGGMRQRAMIAMALSTSPSILIADEPTTALDVTIQAQILDLLMKLQDERKMSLLLITHDLVLWQTSLMKSLSCTQERSWNTEQQRIFSGSRGTRTRGGSSMRFRVSGKTGRNSAPYRAWCPP